MGHLGRPPPGSQISVLACVLLLQKGRGSCLGHLCGDANPIPKAPSSGLITPTPKAQPPNTFTLGARAADVNAYGTNASDGRPGELARGHRLPVRLALLDPHLERRRTKGLCSE